MGYNIGRNLMKNNIMKWPHECITYWYLISKKYNFVWYWNYIIWLHFCPWYYLETGTAGWLRILFLGNYWKRIRNYVREQLACLNSNWFLLILYNCRHGVNTHFRMISSEEIVFFYAIGYIGSFFAHLFLRFGNE